MYVTTNYIEEVDSPASNDFKQRFHAKFPNEPYINQEAANAYDAVYLYKAAVEKAGTTNIWMLFVNRWKVVISVLMDRPESMY